MLFPRSILRPVHCIKAEGVPQISPLSFVLSPPAPPSGRSTPKSWPLTRLTLDYHTRPDSAFNSNERLVEVGGAFPVTIKLQELRGRSLKTEAAKDARVVCPEVARKLDRSSFIKRAHRRS